MARDDLGWDDPPEFEPDPSGEIEQLELTPLEVETPEWKLDLRTRENGLAWVRVVRSTLNTRPRRDR